MYSAYLLLKKDFPNLKAILPIAESIEDSFIQKCLPLDNGLIFVRGNAREVLSISDIAVVTSGTVTVEASLEQVPFVVCYKFSKVTYYLARFFVKGVKWFSLSNIIVNQELVKELFQNEVTPSNIASELKIYINSKSEKKKMMQKLSLVEQELVSKDNNHGLHPAKKVAQMIL